MLVQRLEILSNVDMLTGVKSRNAMNNFVVQMVEGNILRPCRFGIVFADVNGLKPVNDNEGHEAGDNLLRQAAQMLKREFGCYEIFRAGGDEFVIVALDAEKAELEAKVEKLRRESENPENVRFALGSWYDEQGGSIRKAMHEADVEMYKDKKRFYEKFPELSGR